MKLNIGKSIQRMRTSKGVTQEKLAEALGVSCQSISRWELNICYPDMELLPAIADYFDATIDDLMGMGDMASNRPIPFSLGYRPEADVDTKAIRSLLME